MIKPQSIFLYLLFSLFASPAAQAQLPETDIYLLDLKITGDSVLTGKPENITHRKGYDNQPCFTPDGTAILYIADTDSGSTDIFSYSPENRSATRLTQTPESEFSPSLSADQDFLTVVRVDSDSGQRLYNYPFPGTDKPVLIKESDSVGYYCQLDRNTYALFILGEPVTLQLLDTRTGIRITVAEKIGRCIKTLPGKKEFYYSDKSSDSSWYINSMTFDGTEKKRIVPTLPGSEDFCILPDGSFLMGNKGRLYRYIPGTKQWNEIADLSMYLSDFYRIVSDVAGRHLALVVFSGDKP